MQTGIVIQSKAIERDDSHSKAVQFYRKINGDFHLTTTQSKEKQKENVMKKHLVSMVLVCAMVLFGAGMGLAGQGRGPGDGTGPIHDVLDGVYFEFTGDVIVSAMGGGLTLATATGNVQIYGIGPFFYWTSQNVGYPVIGDTLTAKGYTVNYNGVDQNVAISITIDGSTILLRDLVTGAPLWRGGSGGGGICK